MYAGGYEKGDWYLNAFNNYGIMPMFSMPDHGHHSKRKRMLSNIYAKSTLQGSQAMDAITKTLLNDTMVPKLKKLAKINNGEVEMYDFFSAAAMDFVAAYVFGLANSSQFVKLDDMAKPFFRDYKARQGFTFWPQEMPKFYRVMASLGLDSLLVPTWVGEANQHIEAWLIGMCDKAEQTMQKAQVDGEKGRPEDWPTVYAQLRNALIKESQTKSSSDLSTEQIVSTNRLAVASEMLDHTLAGFDTSSIALAFLAYELSLSHNSSWQDKLRNELLPLKGNSDAKTLDNLPILHAILMETLRYHASIPGNQPRITPSSATLGAPGHEITNLPANIRVQAQAWSLHRDPKVFPEPESWNPARWLESSEEQLREMQRWFWAFGSGGRMCVGSNLAMLDMKAIVAGVWGNFRTELVDGIGMVHNGGYVAEPVGCKGKFCVLRLKELEV